MWDSEISDFDKIIHNPGYVIDLDVLARFLVRRLLIFVQPAQPVF